MAFNFYFIKLKIFDSASKITIKKQQIITK